MTGEHGLAVIFVVGMMAVSTAIDSMVAGSKKHEPAPDAVMLVGICMVFSISKIMWMVGENGAPFIIICFVGMMAVLAAVESKLTENTETKPLPGAVMHVDEKRPSSLAKGSLFDRRWSSQKALGKGNCLILLLALLRYARNQNPFTKKYSF